MNNGADVNVKNKRGYTPLHIAILVGSKEVVQLMLEAQADVAITCKDGSTLELANKSGNKEIISIINGAVTKGLEAKISSGNPLSVAARKSAYMKKPLPSPPSRIRSSSIFATSEIHSMECYHGPITSEQAEQLVSADKKQSGFLLRTSPMRDCYAMTVYNALIKEVTHFLLYPRKGGFAIQDSDDIVVYPTVTALITSSPIVKGYNAIPREEGQQFAEMKKKIESLQQLLPLVLADLGNETKWASSREKLKRSLMDLSSNL